MGVQWKLIVMPGRRESAKVIVLGVPRVQKANKCSFLSDHVKVSVLVFAIFSTFFEQWAYPAPYVQYSGQMYNSFLKVVKNIVNIILISDEWFNAQCPWNQCLNQLLSSDFSFLY